MGENPLYLSVALNIALGRMSKAYRGISLIGKGTHLEFFRRPMPEILGVS